MTRLLVCGGRDFNQAGVVRGVLDEWHRRRPILVVVHGAARGADALAGEWAVARGVATDVYPVSASEWAAWKAAGRPRPSPGAARNARMLAEGRPDAVLAFPGGAGTADMLRRSQRALVPSARVLVDAGGWVVERL